MELKKNCSTCEFNFNGICAGSGSTYQYGEEITDDTKTCEGWSADLDFFIEDITCAPRFLREQFNECKISYDEFTTQSEQFAEGKAIPINIFDAIKYIYGISMVDIATLLNVSFGVVYRAKTKGVPQKRVKQFAEVLCIDSELLKSNSTEDFNKLYEAREVFFNQEQIEQRMNLMPDWKKELAYSISNVYLKCPINLSKRFARVDKFYWTSKMKLGDFTESEKQLINYIVSHNRQGKVCEIEYSLDIGGRPHMRVAYSK